jgi:hypothetical protein
MTDNDGENILPTGFWAVPEQFIADQTLRFLHSEVLARLRHETPDADTLEQMCMERVASLYFYMRGREMSGGLNNAAAYKSIMALWVQMAADLRRNRRDDVNAEKIRAEVTGELVSAVKDSLKGLEPEVAMTVTRRLRQTLSV